MHVGGSGSPFGINSGYIFGFPGLGLTLRLILYLSRLWLEGLNPQNHNWINKGLTVMLNQLRKTENVTTITPEGRPGADLRTVLAAVFIKRSGGIASEIAMAMLS